MPPVTVLVVDDSALTREMITAILSSDEEIRIAGEAKNGIEAVAKVLELKPSVVTMDLQMPEMGGIEAIERIMAVAAVPILVISAVSDAATAYEAVSRGALDVLAKCEVDPDAPDVLISKVKLLAGVRVIPHILGKRTGRLQMETMGRRPVSTTKPYRIVAVAASTGGPKALCTLMGALPANFPLPVVVAQHISDGFAPGLALWLDRISRLRVKTAEEGEPLNAGTVYISPSERHLKIRPDLSVELVARKAGDVYRPSCDVLLRSVAEAYGAGSIGVILTGMGSDGVEGIRSIKDRGGIAIAQDEKTSAVFGMPGVAVALGCIDHVLPLDRIAAELAELAGVGGEFGSGTH